MSRNFGIDNQGRPKSIDAPDLHDEPHYVGPLDDDAPTGIVAAYLVVAIFGALVGSIITAAVMMAVLR